MDEAIEKQNEALTRHWLCKVMIDGLSVFRVLCLPCRNQTQGFKRISFSELVCEECGRKWIPPPGGHLFVKDQTVTITARYPDLESVRNQLS